MEQSRSKFGRGRVKESVYVFLSLFTYNFFSIVHYSLVIKLINFFVISISLLFGSWLRHLAHGNVAERFGLDPYHISDFTSSHWKWHWKWLNFHPNLPLDEKNQEILSLMGLPARWECRTGVGRDLSSSLCPPRCPVRVARVVMAEAPPPPPSVQPQKPSWRKREDLTSGLASPSLRPFTTIFTTIFIPFLCLKLCNDYVIIKYQEWNCWQSG